MSRLVHRKIEMLEMKEDLPHRFVDREMVYVVAELLDRWQEAGDWRDHQPNRFMYRVVTADMSVFDLEYSDAWYIYKVWD